MFFKLLLSHIYFCEYEIPSSSFDRLDIWNYFYCDVTSYSLSIDKRFLGNQCVSITDDTDFAWYSKCGGKNYGLKFIFHLKDKKGRIFNPSMWPLERNTEIVYDDGSVTPFMPLSPLKDKNPPEQAKSCFGHFCLVVYGVILWLCFDCFCLVLVIFLVLHGCTYYQVLQENPRGTHTARI